MSETIEYQGATYRTAMAVILPNVIGKDWGWYSRDHQRMHLQPVGRSLPKRSVKIHVWLEDRGTRVFRIDPKDKLRAKEIRELREAIEEYREDIEKEWIAWAIDKDWIHFDIVGDLLTVLVYEGRNRFARQIHLRDDLHLRPEAIAEIHDSNNFLDADSANLILRGDQREARWIHVPLEDYLWIRPESPVLKEGE